MTNDYDATAVAEAAIGDIDPALLTGTGTGGLFTTGYFRDGPVLERLKPGEQLEYAFSNKKRGIEIQRATSTEQVVPGSDYRSAILVTDQRILCVFGKRTGDRTIEIPYHLVTSTSVSTGIRRDKIAVAGDNVTYNLYTPKRSGARTRPLHTAC